MHKSARLRWQDVRDVFHLIGECRDLGRDPCAWRLHLLEGLLRILHAQLGFAGVEHVTNFSSELRPMVAVGWPSDVCRRRFADFQNEIGNTRLHLFKSRLLEHRPTGPGLVRLRQDLLDDREWTSSVMFNEYLRVGDVNETLHVLLHRGDGVVGVISLHRTLRDCRFQPHDRLVMELLTDELLPLVGRSLALDGPSAHGLSPRLRDVLACLLEGDAEKQIARRLGLSAHYLHQCVKAVYRHFEVSSRGELLARYVRPPFPSGSGGAA